MKNKFIQPNLLCCIAVLVITFSCPITGYGQHLSQDSSGKADSISVVNLKSLMHAGSDIQVVDVRLKKDFDRRKVIPGAKWHDPDQVAQWAKSLDKNKPVIIYCVHGHKVSQQVVDQLRQSGITAQRLEGGIEAWKKQEGTVTSLKE